MLPTFLGIGVPRSGTTWLNDVLSSHPDVLMAQGRKEVRFFNENHERGLGWYERFFPETTPTPAAIGEFTPGYLFHPDAPARVAALGSVDRFLVSFRDPIDRLVSHYRARQRVDHFVGSLEEFMAAYPHAVDQGRYATHLERWLDRFPRDQFLIMTFESAIADVETTKKRLASFLDLDVARFPVDAGAIARNQAFLPRQPRLYAFAKRTTRFLRRHDIDLLDKLGDHIKGRVVRRAETGSPTEVPDELHRRLVDLYQPEAQRLEKLAGVSVDGWRSAPA